MTATVLELPARARLRPPPPARFDLPIDLPAVFSVGEWARNIINEWQQTPAVILDDNDQLQPHPDRARTARAAAAALRTASLALHIPISEAGPCAGCRTITRRYGNHGGPLCPGCAGRLAGRR